MTGTAVSVPAPPTPNVEPPLWYGDGDIAFRLLAYVIGASQAGLLSPVEHSWLRRIEGLHARLRKDETLAQFAKVAKRGRSGLLLFRLVREFAPVSCLELGTSIGFSAAFQAAALELNGSGRLLTLERKPMLVELARNHFAWLGLSRVAVREGRFQDTLGDALKEMTPIDFAFIDGHHDEQATFEYFDRIHGALAASAVLVFDDIKWSEGMERAWSRISSDHRVGIAADLGNIGVCVTGLPSPPIYLTLKAFT
jgi:predicted O-methyltransferase YrrM